MSYAGDIRGFFKMLDEAIPELQQPELVARLIDQALCMGLEHSHPMDIILSEKDDDWYGEQATRAAVWLKEQIEVSK